ncbi:hypothetical protein [Defluviicoccus vanus]|uniref:Uncharacterized protein n=1 Tax=Defluviicoccus vanus TaxID=111831 RepID=A0A7H1N381_9PROT|nr:hypothetical protein [Defluviicoccus vanus]QNT70167.1 hypothetical protein HQ394_13610 [Defluviicoccus vanus]
MRYYFHLRVAAIALAIAGFGAVSPMPTAAAPISAVVLRAAVPASQPTSFLGTAPSKQFMIISVARRAAVATPSGSVKSVAVAKKK